jgi:eukaryotic-like serine/threonine-protein kinase
MALASATRLGPYEIIDLLGTGGMGEVYRATDTRLGRTVAVKILNSQFSERFETEARAISSVNHPHICALYDIGTHEGRSYLVLEYLEGKPLEGPLGTDEALRLATQIAGALEAAHQRGIIHRDLKPANIMVTAAGVKLLDFGLAKLAPTSDADITRTIEGTVMGTAAYMAPEQAEGKSIDTRSDVFSFGAVLYEMLTGRRAFRGDSVVAVLSAVLRDHPDPLGPGVPPGLEAIVVRCLQKDPAERFQHMREVRVALEALRTPSQSTSNASFSELPTQTLPTQAARPDASIAVLPFANLSADKENEYFSDGLSEEIINALTHVPGLKVTARTSAFAFRGEKQDIRKIAGTLHVRTILDGSVRRAGNRIRVTVQLINADDGYHLWSERYDRELADVFAVQDEISAAIAEALKLEFSGEAAVVRRHRPNLPAYEALLKGRHAISKLTPEGLAQSREFFEQAAALDPEFALAYVGLGSHFFVLALNGLRPARETMPLLRAAAQKALELDPSLPDAHALMGVVAAGYDYDWNQAGQRFRVAMATESVDAMSRWCYAFFYLMPFNRLREATELMRRALEEDPLNEIIRQGFASCLIAGGKHEQGIAEVRKVLEADPNFWTAHLQLGFYYLVQGMNAEAMEPVQKAFQLAPWNARAIGIMAGALVRTGNTAQAEGLIRKLRESSETQGVPMGLVFFHCICGEVEEAAAWYDKAIDERDPSVISLLGGLIKTLRSSSRWPALASRLNLPETK